MYSKALIFVNWYPSKGAKITDVLKIKGKKETEQQVKYFVTNAHQIAPFPGYILMIFFRSEGAHPPLTPPFKRTRNKNTTLFFMEKEQWASMNNFIKNGH